jgi:hypothetical protein
MNIKENSRLDMDMETTTLIGESVPVLPSFSVVVIAYNSEAVLHWHVLRRIRKST